MIIAQDKITEYLEAYHAGKISMGLDCGVYELDHAIRYKQGQLVVINGHDNVGKTAWIIWYFLCLSVKHDIKWTIWSGENDSGQLVSTLIEFYTGKRINQLDFKEVLKLQNKMNNWFTFVDNSNIYTAEELFKIFEETKSDGCLIDPYTGLNRSYTHAANYEFLNLSRHFCNRTGITLYVNTHPQSEASRREYPKGHEWEGYQMPPKKSDTEGGQPFANRPDDFITIHRLVGHPTEQYNTHVYVRKVKNTRTGGQVTDIKTPILFNYNGGFGFTNNGSSPLNSTIKDDLELTNETLNKMRGEVEW